MKRIVLFLVTNIAVLLVLTIIMQVFGIGQYLTQQGQGFQPDRPEVERHADVDEEHGNEEPVTDARKLGFQNSLFPEHEGK